MACLFSDYQRCHIFSTNTQILTHLFLLGPRGRVGISKLHEMPSLEQPEHCAAASGPPESKTHFLLLALQASHARDASSRLGVAASLSGDSETMATVWMGWR
jgi:hypothetical protein